MILPMKRFEGKSIRARKRPSLPCAAAEAGRVTDMTSRHTAVRTASSTEVVLFAFCFARASSSVFSDAKGDASRSCTSGRFTAAWMWT